MKLVLAAFICIALAGCATPDQSVYSGPMGRAMRDCQYQAHLATAGAMASAGSGYHYAVVAQQTADQRRELTEECLHQRGFGLYSHTHKATVRYQRADGTDPNPGDDYFCAAQADAKFDNGSQYADWIKTLTACMTAHGYEAVPLDVKGEQPVAGK